MKRVCVNIHREICHTTETVRLVSIPSISGLRLRMEAWGGVEKGGNGIHLDNPN